MPIPPHLPQMQYGYDDELFQAWRDGKIGEKDLPEEVMAMTLDLCERWRAEQERCRRVHAEQRLSRDPGPSHSRSRTVSGTAPVLPQSTMCCHKAPLAISRGGRSEALGRSLCVIRVGIHQW